MFSRKPLLTTQRLELRLPRNSDFEAWSQLRAENHDFLTRWEPKRREDQHSKAMFRKRVRWSRHSFRELRAMPLVIIRRTDRQMIGALTVDNIRFGPSQSATLGYWLGESFTGQGYMSEAVERVVGYIFSTLDISRIEAACLEENTASRRVLEGAGFRYEGVAQSYLQINGRWRAHILFANLRRDRLGKTQTGVH